MGKVLTLTTRGPWKKYVEMRPDTRALKPLHGIEALLDDSGMDRLLHDIDLPLARPRESNAEGQSFAEILAECQSILERGPLADHKKRPPKAAK